MAENKTKPTDLSVDEAIARFGPAIEADSRSVIAMMQAISGEPAVMWGTTIVGFGKYAYKYESGRTGEAQAMGFAPRKDKLTIYLHGGLDAVHDLMPSLGKHKLEGSCLHIKRLQDVDQAVLRQVLERVYTALRARWQ